MHPRRLTGLAVIAIGAVLALFFWESRWHWFQGGPLGLGLMLLGLLEAVEGRGGRRP